MVVEMKKHYIVTLEEHPEERAQIKKAHDLVSKYIYGDWTFAELISEAGYLSLRNEQVAVTISGENSRRDDIEDLVVSAFHNDPRFTDLTDNEKQELKNTIFRMSCIAMSDYLSLDIADIIKKVQDEIYENISAGRDIGFVD